MIRYVSISKSYLMIHPDTLTSPQITLILYGAQSSSHLDFDSKLCVVYRDRIVLVV